MKQKLTWALVNITYFDSEKEGSAYIKQFMNKTYMDIFYKLVSFGNNEILNLYCDLVGSRCAIFHGDANNGAPCICKIYKEYDAKHFFAGKDNYSIQIAPNVDASLMLGLGAVFDEIKHDDKQSKS